MSNSFIWPIDQPLSGATTPSQSGPGSEGNEGVLRIPRSSSITEASLSDCLMSYQDTRWECRIPLAEIQSVYSATSTDWATRHSLWVGSYSSVEMQSVYPVATADWALKNKKKTSYFAFFFLICIIVGKIFVYFFFVVVEMWHNVIGKCRWTMSHISKLYLSLATCIQQFGARNMREDKI